MMYPDIFANEKDEYTLGQMKRSFKLGAAVALKEVNERHTSKTTSAQTIKLLVEVLDEFTNLPS